MAMLVLLALTFGIFVRLVPVFSMSGYDEVIESSSPGCFCGRRRPMA